MGADAHEEWIGFSEQEWLTLVVITQEHQEDRNDMLMSKHMLVRENKPSTFKIQWLC